MKSEEFATARKSTSIRRENHSTIIIQQSTFKQIEGEVLNWGLLLFFFLLLVIGELQHQLAGVGRTTGIQAVIAATTSTLDERLLGLAVTKQILLHVVVYFLVVGLIEKGAIHVIDVLRNGLHTYATLTGLGKYLEYLLIVIQNS